jgi:hypothetical protein
MSRLVRCLPGSSDKQFLQVTDIAALCIKSATADMTMMMRRMVNGTLLAFLSDIHVQTTPFVVLEVLMAFRVGAKYCSTWLVILPNSALAHVETPRLLVTLYSRWSIYRCH